MAGNFGNAYKNIRIRRGLAANLPILADGEQAFAYDTQAFYVGYGGVNYQITGTISVPNLLSVNTQTGPYTVLNSDDVILMNSSTPVDITMQANSSATSKAYRIKNIGAGSVTILPNGTDTFFTTASQSSILLADTGFAVELIPNKAGIWAAF